MLRPTARGFTLLEVLLALAILGLTMTLVGDLVRLASGATRHGSGLADENRRRAAAYDLFRAEISGCLLLPGSFGREDGRAAADEGASSIRCLTRGARPGDPGERLIDVTYLFRSIGDRLELVRRQASYRPGTAAPADRPAVERVLLTGLVSARFDYFDPGTRQWRSDPPGRAGLPLLVRGAMADQGGALPPLVARPAVEAEIGCLTGIAGAPCAAQADRGR